MKPIRLQMQAFCSYVRGNVPFERLGGRGLYLITGNTGAGKTTLFDAICFALYGFASGEARRDPGLLRCKSARPDDETFVEFEFEHRGQVYTVRRSPPYQRPRKRGEGYIREEPKALLTLPGGRAVERVTAVDREVERILGLTREHFSKIAMIAQGDFAKLLLAPVEDRRAILQSIFGTQYFERVQKILQVRAGALEDRWTSARRGIAADFKKLRLPPDADGAAFAPFASEDAAGRFGDWRPLAQALVDADRAARDEKERARAQARGDVDRLMLTRGAAERDNADFDRLARAEGALEALAQDRARVDGLRLEARLAEAALTVDGDAAARARTENELRELREHIARQGRSRN